jgi:hypothetical protein
MSRGFLRSLHGALAVVAFATVAQAQVEQGSIAGTVFDETGRVVPGARVVVVHEETRRARETASGGDGRYAVPYLAAGRYEVSAELKGFSRARVTSVPLRVGLAATVDLVLRPGAMQTEITVTASAAQLELQGGALGTVIGSRQILELPVVGRNPYSLVVLAPGVVDRGNAGTGPLINGGRSNASEVLLDGAEQRNSTTNDLNYSPPLESVEEFKVITNGFSAEFGRSGGGVITAATRAGTNALHGSAYGYVRRDGLNANSWTNKRNNVPRGKEHVDQYGFTIGGPILKDRTFFFVNVERSRSQSPDNVIGTVPTLRQRGGDFSDTRNSAGQLITIYDPLTTRPDPTTPGRFIRDPFPGNVIPPDRLDPIALKILQYYPTPTNGSATQNFVQERTRISRGLPIVARVDHNWGRQHLFAAFRQTNSEDDSPTVSIAFPDPGTNGERGTRANDRVSAVLSDTVTFGSTLVGEFRASYTRNRFTTTPATLGFDFTQLGIGSSVKEHSSVAMFPRIEVGNGVDSLGMNRAGLIDDKEDTRELQGHLTWLGGAHVVKAGFQAARMGFDVFRPEYPSGQYVFSAGFTQGPNPAQANNTGFGLASFLLGAPTSGRITGDPHFDTRQTYWAGYVQDDWRILRNLTASIGLRYEYQTPWSEEDDQLTFFDPQAIEPLTGRPGVLRLVGRDGASRYQTDPDRNNFAPRLGLAWHFTEAMVARAGYAILYYPGSGGIGSAPSDLGEGGFLTTTNVNLGQLPTPLLGALNTPPPGASLANPFTAGYFVPPATQVGGGITTAFRDLVTPSGQVWNVSLQRRLPGQMIVEAAYVGSRHRNIWSNVARNAIPSEHLSQGTALNNAVPNPFFGIIRSGDAALTGRTTTATQLLRPFPQYTGITRFRDSVGDSWYHGLTLRLEKHSASGLTCQATYTFSKEIDTVPERFGARVSQGIVDPGNLDRARSVADDDRTHVATMNFIWEVPVGPGRRWASRGWVAQAIGGWRLSGIGLLATGRPLVVTVPVSNGTTGIGAYADMVGSPVLPKGQQSYDRWFDTTAFAAPAAFTLGNGSRTIAQVRGPSMKRLDLLLSRLQKIGPTSLEMRLEAQNALNTPQFTANDQQPEGSLTNPSFGKILRGGGERRLQVGLRLAF